MDTCDKKCKGMCVCAKVGKTLLIIGGLNWGVFGIGILMGNNNLNLVNMVFGNIPTLEAVIYVLVGVAAIMKIFGCMCKKSMGVRGACCGAQNAEVKI